ncbi:MAG TPA: hypothetical protein VFU50_05990 [Terriglobales bacterium]|nr:hypothetical protein [Terriglobales bacterium]
MKLLRNSLLGLSLLCCVLAIREAVRYGREWLTVDSCLDSGGSFDYSRMACDYAVNHPFIPYGYRHPASFRVCAAAILCGVSAALISHQLSRNAQRSN